jgi:alpha-L-fucosidase
VGNYTRREFVKMAAAGGSLGLMPTSLAAAEGALRTQDKRASSDEETTAYRERTQWFHEARFGMFIHWGIMSMVPGCWSQFQELIAMKEYAKLADRFKGEKFDAHAWAGLAAEAGMKYMVLTTRHHDGFCLFDSKVSDFTSVKTAAKRDFVAEYVAACRQAGLRVGFYYSLLDWRFPGYFEREKYPESAAALVQQAHDQIRELLSNYGPIDIFWSDGQWFWSKGTIDWEAIKKPEVMRSFWRAQELETMIRTLQPNILINDRLGGVPGDYDTTEQRVGEARDGRAWEACMTIPDHDGWSYVHNSLSRKSVPQLLRHLVMAARGEGNFLLNVGPKPDGSIPEEEQAILREIGKWMKRHGEGIYGSQVPPTFGTTIAIWTRKANTGYLYLLAWPGETLVVARIASKVKSATLLSTGEPVHFRQEYNGRLVFSGLPADPPDPYMPAIKVVFDGEFRALEEKNQAAWLTGEA